MRSGRLLAAVAVLVLGLAGCSEEQSASETLPTTAVTTEATPSLEALGPPDLPMPAEAREQSVEGVTAFTRYYLDLINRTSTVMDSTFIRQFSDDCETCTRIADDTDADAAAGYRYTGGRIAITSLAPATLSPPKADLAFVADQAALSVVDAQGNPVTDLQFTELPGLSCGIALRWNASASTWTVEQLTLG